MLCLNAKLHFKMSLIIASADIYNQIVYCALFDSSVLQKMALPSSLFTVTAVVDRAKMTVSNFLRVVAISDVRGRNQMNSLAATLQALCAETSCCCGEAFSAKMTLCAI